MRKEIAVKRKTHLPELLAPAGSPESLYAAVSAGADAVYLGGLHSARAFAKNFDEGELADGVRYAHLHGVQVYVALNTLLYDRELTEVLPYAARLAAMGVDAAIVADLGLMSLLHRELPELALHASTQAFIHNTRTADLYHRMGATRVVAARELSLDAITRMTEDCRAEVEIFLHGALCVSHSGQCLFSSLVGGRSGNRGECAQPCRLPYGKGYPLSLSDLALAGHIPALIASGVSSLKIEGRMKSPAYVAGVTGVYRRLLDEGRAATEEEWQTLTALFSRSGFTDRYLTATHDRPMLGVRTEADKQESRTYQEKCEVSFTKQEAFVKGEAEIRIGRPSRMTLALGERSVTVYGDPAAPAERAPLTAEEVTARLGRLGGTSLAFPAGGLTVTLDPGAFMTAGALNALRRKAVAALLGEPKEPREVTYLPPALPSAKIPRRAAVCYTAEGGRICRESGFFGRVYLTLAEHSRYPTEGVVIPPVLTDAEAEPALSELIAARERGATHALCEHYGAIALAREAGLTPVGGHRLNITNRASLASLAALGVEDICLSPELTAPRLRELSGRIITYGRIPLMLTERCFIREGFGCEACGRAALTDRRGARFPLLREYGHRNLLLNSLPTYLADRPALLHEAGDPCECYLFTVETGKEIAAVLAAAKAKRSLPFAVRRLPK